MAILTLSGSSSDLNAYPSASVAFYNSPYDAINSIDGDTGTFAGVQTDDVPGEFYQILFDTSSITGEAQKYLTYKGIQSVEFTMARNTLGRIVFITNPEGTEFSEEWGYANPNGLGDSSIYEITINPEDRPYGRSFGNTKIYGLRIYFDDWYNPGSVADARVYEIIIDYNPPSGEDFYEFNDSVLTTKAWNSSRYDGRQLEGAIINKFRSGDTSYGRTPVVRNLSNTFYISSEIISLNNSGSDNFEDPTLQYIPGFSYVLLGKSVTINDDNTVIVKDISTLGGLEDLASIGFRREYQSNIPIGSFVSLINTDDSVPNRSFNQYNVYYNKGRLQPLFTFINASDIGNHTANSVGISNGVDKPERGNGLGSWPSGEGFHQLTHHFKSGGSLVPAARGTVLESRENSGILRSFFTGALNDIDPYGSYGGAPEINLVNTTNYIEFMDTLQNELSTTKNIFCVSALNSRFYGRTSSDLGANKDYVVFDETAFGVGTNPGAGIVTENQYLYETPPIITDTSASGFYLDAKDISFIATNEINSVIATPVGGVTMSLSNKYPAQQVYESPISQSSSPFGAPRIFFQAFSADRQINPTAFRGDYTISYLNQDKPALLLKLIKEQEYPQGQGTKPLVVLPQNLHPYIKDNLIYFLAKAGLDIGDRKVVPGLDQSKRYLDRIGWKPPKPAPTIVLEEEREEKTKITFEQRRLLARQLAEQNRRRRLERLREEEENQRRNKRQSKREDRQEERKERKKRREERKENRRENRQERREDRRENRQNRRENRRNRRRNR